MMILAAKIYTRTIVRDLARKLVEAGAEIASDFIADDVPPLTGTPGGGGGGVSRDTLVCRGGLCTAKSFETGTGVTRGADGKLSGISTQSRPGASLETLAQPFKNGQLGRCTVGDIEDAGGWVVFDGHPKNPNHATVSGITAEKAQQLFTPTIPNPVPKEVRGTFPRMPPNN
jgi:hypothetical protein